jgi:methylenetetrahydrofolate reductase (NADPH)
MIRLAPGNPFDTERATTPEIRKRLEAHYGRDKSLPLQYVAFMKNLVLHGYGPNGNTMEPRLEFQVGATAHPYMRPLELSLLRLRKKIHAGADFLFTQAVFDLGGFFEWMKGVQAAGFDKRTAIIASILPLASVENARELQQAHTYGPIPDSVIDRISRAKDPAREGVAIASEIAKQLKDVPEIRGIHILNGGDDQLIADVIKQAGI